MPFGDIAGGFAEGFSGAYGQAQERRRLSEVLNFQKQQAAQEQSNLDRQFGFQEQQAEQEQGRFEARLGFDVQRAEETDEQFRLRLEQDVREFGAAEAQNRWQRQFSEKQHQLQLREADLNSMTMLSQLFDSTKPKQWRQFLLDGMGKQFGIDPKSDQYKSISKLIMGLDPDTLKTANDALAAAYPNMQPGQVAAMAKGLVSGMFTPDQISSLMTRPALQLRSIKNPEDPTKDILVPEEQAAYQEPSEGTPTVSIDQRTASAETQDLRAIAVEDAKLELEEARAARKVMPFVRQYLTAAKSGRFVSGPASSPRRFLGEVMEFVGGDPELGGILKGNDPVTADIMENASLKMAEGIAATMSRMTNMSLQFVLDQVPSLSKTPGGNKLIAEMMETTSQRSAALEKALQPFIKAGTLYPETGPSWAETRDRIIADYAPEDEDLQRRIEAEAGKGRGINWEAIPGVGKRVRGAVEGAADAAGAIIDEASGYPVGSQAQDASGTVYTLNAEGKWLDAQGREFGAPAASATELRRPK